MNPVIVSADMVRHFRDVLEQCKVTTGENVLIFTDPQFPHYYYAPAALAAASSLGAKAHILIVQSGVTLEERLSRAAWTAADVILGMSFLPGGFSWMYSDLHNAALRAGARVMMIQEPFDVLERLKPTPALRERGVNGAQLMERAKVVRITSETGTDLVFRKDGRKGSYQCGLADVPGRWDHWPSGMVYCAPIEDSAEGVLVVTPGDILLGLHRYASSEIRFTFKEGMITRIEGGSDAVVVKAHLERAGDEGAFRLGHAGWGTDDRANWGTIGMDSESFYGGVTIALGRNIFDSPAPMCGLGGNNRSNIHFDICCRGMDMYLDERPVLKNGEFVLDVLK